MGRFCLPVFLIIAKGKLGLAVGPDILASARIMFLVIDIAEQPEVYWRRGQAGIRPVAVNGTGEKGRHVYSNKEVAMRRKTGMMIMFAVFFLVSVTATCRKTGESESAQGTTPIDDLIKAGKGPIEVGPLFRGISPIAPTFTLTLKNISDRPVKTVSGTVLYFDENDKLVPEAKAELNYGDLTEIKPGESIKLSTMTENEKAVKGKWIIKQVIYLKTNPVDKIYGDLPYKWTNPNFEAELKAAEIK
jgi:hypothetical protein